MGEGAIVTSALQAGFSFVFKERVAMTIVIECQRMGLTLTIMKIKQKRNSRFIRILLTAWLLACLRCGPPIVGEQLRP
jgi:hypothetical protein